VLGIAGCASGSNSGASAAPVVGSVQQDQRLKTSDAGAYSTTSMESRDVMTATVAAPLDSVWHVLGSVFLELGIEPGTVNNEEHYIANTSFLVSRKLGGVSISKYLDCGSSATGPLAQQASITMSLSVQVATTDSADVSQLRSQVNGYAVAEGAVAARALCGSTGQLEARIARMVNDALAHRSKK
jgi:hypothetical protein